MMPLLPAVPKNIMRSLLPFPTSAIGDAVLLCEPCCACEYLPPKYFGLALIEFCRSADVQPVESAASSQALQARSEEPSLSEGSATSVRGSESSRSSALSALTAEIVECREVDEILEVVSEEAGQSLTIFYRAPQILSPALRCRVLQARGNHFLWIAVWS